MKNPKQRASTDAKEYYGDESFASILESALTPELRDLFREQYKNAKAITEEHMRLLKEILLEEIPGLSVYNSNETLDMLHYPKETI